MGIVLTEKDYQPLATYTFQHWNERTGPAFCNMRPLTEDAARRVWQRACVMTQAAWADGEGNHRFDLQNSDWDGPRVRDWLLACVPERDHRVIVCFQPQSAISVPWGDLCDHWLLLLWTGGCAWPADERWVMVHDGEQFVFGKRADENNSR